MKNYIVRLQVRTTKRLNADKERVLLSFKGRELSISSSNSGSKLSESDWLIFQAEGFETNELAVEYGEQLRGAVNLSGYFRGYGFDLGDDMAKGSFNEAGLKDLGWIPKDVTIGDNVHGLLVYAKAENTVFLKFEASMTVLEDPQSFQRALTVAEGFVGGVPKTVLLVSRLLNSALNATHPLSRFLLAVIAVEAAAAGDDRWSNAQEAALSNVQHFVVSLPNLSDHERLEIVESIEKLRRVSVNQSIRRLLNVLDLSDHYARWNALYSSRSKILHGVSQVKQDEVVQLSTEAYGFASLVCQRLIERSGYGIPEDIAINLPK